MKNTEKAVIFTCFMALFAFYVVKYIGYLSYINTAATSERFELESWDWSRNVDNFP